MLNTIFRRTDKVVPVDGLIDAVLDEMHKIGVHSSEYPNLLDKLERLYELKAKDRRNPVSHETIALIAGNLFGILIIVAAEKTHVLSLKGLQQVIRPKGI